MANYNPFDEREIEKKREQNWFAKTAIQGAFLTGTAATGAFALWKIKGPARKILEKIHDNSIMSAFSKASAKAGDDFAEIAKRRTAAAQDLARRTMGKKWDSDIVDSWKQANTEDTLKNEIRRIEEGILVKGEVDISVAERGIRYRPIGQKLDTTKYIALNRALGVPRDYSNRRPEIYLPRRKLKGSEAEQFARLRQRVILEYIDRYGINTEADIGTILSEEATEAGAYFSGEEYLTGTPIEEDSLGGKVVKRVTAIHDSYMSDKKYAELYYKRLRELNGRYRASSYSYESGKVTRKPPIKIDSNNWRSFLYGLDAEAINLRDGPAALPNKVEALWVGRKANQVMKKVTSAGQMNLDKGFSKLRQLSEIEYTPYLKRLKDVLTEASKPHNQGDTGIKDFSLHIDTFGSGPAEKRYLKISLQHTNENYTDPIEIKVPIATDGRLPGTSPGVRDHLGRFHRVGNYWGTNYENMKKVHSSELLLHNIIDMFDSAAVSGIDAFRDNPKKFARQVSRRVQGMLERLPAATGAVRDEVMLLAEDDPMLRELLFPTKGSSRRAKQNLGNFVRSAHNMRKIRGTGRKSVAITLDLEGMSNKNSGPQWMVKDRYAQWTKAGVVASDITRGGNKVLNFFDLQSDHGYKFYSRMDDSYGPGQGFNSTLDEFLDRMVLEEKYRGSPNKKAALAMQLNAIKAKNPGGFYSAADNYDFFRELKNRIQDMINKLERDGYDKEDIYFVTKNGDEFDLRILEEYIPDRKFIDFIKNRSIDVQSILYARKHGSFASGSLSQEKVVQAMLGRLGIPEDDIAKLFKKGTNTGNIERILRQVAKKNRSISGNLFKILNIDEANIRRLSKSGMLTSFHLSPVLDSLFTAAILGEEYHNFLNNDTLYSAVDPIRKALEATKRPKNISELMSYMEYMQKKAVPGSEVADFSAVSHGMASQLIGSMLHLNDLLAFPDNPLPKQWNQLFGQTWLVKPSNVWLNRGSEYGMGKKSELMRRFRPIVSTDYLSALLPKYVPKATDLQNFYSNTVMSRTLYTWNPYAGKEGMRYVTEKWLGEFGLQREWNVRIGEIAETDPLLSTQIQRFAKAQEEVLKKRGIPLVDATDLDWTSAAEEVAKNPKTSWEVDLDSALLSANKYGGEVALHKKDMRGRIVNVIREREQVGGGSKVSRLMATVRAGMSGNEIMSQSIQSRTEGSKSILQLAKTLADGFAYGIAQGFDATAEADFLKKGHVGATKSVLFNSLIYDMYAKLNAKSITEKDKNRIMEVIKKMQTKLNAQADPQNWSFKMLRNKELTDPGKKVGDVDAFIRYIGNNNLRISDLNRWAMDSGMVWNQAEIDNLSRKVDLEKVTKVYEDSMDKMISDVKKMIKGNDKTLRGLTGQQQEDIVEDLQAMKSFLKPNVGSAKFFVPHMIADNQWAMGLPTWEAVSLYGIEGRGSRMMDAKFRRDYMLAIENSSTHISKSSIDYIKRSLYADRFAEYQSALNTHRRFKDALLSKSLAKKPLDLQQINFIIDREKSLAERSERLKMGSDHDYADATMGKLARVRAEIEELRDNNIRLKRDPIYTELLEREITQINELLDVDNAYAFTESLKKSHKFLTATEVDQFEQLLGAHDGLVSINLNLGQGNDPLVLDLEEDVRKMFMGIGGAKHLDKNDIKVISQKMIKAFEDLTDYAKKHSADGIKPAFKFEDGKLYMNDLIMPWDPIRSNVFNTVSPGRLYMPTPDTAVKMDVMRSVAKLQHIISKKGPDAQAQIENMKQDILRYLMIATPADASSKFWMSQQYAPRGKWSTHMGIEAVQSRAIWALGDGRLTHHFGKLGNKGNMVLENIIKAQMNTILVTESWMKQYKIKRPDGVEISYLRHIEDSLGKGVAADVKRGLRELPGGIFYRFPITQAGSDGLLDAQMLVIPDNIAGHLGMDANTFYAHTILSGLQKWDNDGDQGLIHLKELGTLDTFNKYSAENRESLGKVMQSHGIADIVKKSRMAFDEHGNLVKKLEIGPINQIISHGEGGKVWVSTYNPETYRMEPKFVDSKMLDLSKQFDQVKDLAVAMVKHTPFAVNQDYARQVISSQMTPMISKHLIPITTNVIKKRTFQLIAAAEAGLVKNPRAVYDFIGNLRHGQVGLAQAAIDFGKHADPTKAARFSNALQYINDPLGNNQFKNDALEAFVEQFKDYIDGPPRDLLEEQFKIATGEIESYERLSRLSQDFRTLDNSMTDMVMGRTKASTWDWLRTHFDHTFDDDSIFSGAKRISPMAEVFDSIKTRLRLTTDDVATFKRGGKYAAIGAAALLGLSLFRPFGDSRSLNPMDMFIDLGTGVNGNHNIIHSDLELPRSLPLDMVDASFSKEAYVRMNDRKNYNRDNSIIINSLLKNSMLARPNEMYQFRSKPNLRYANYTTNISRLGTMDLDRRSSVI